MLRPHALGVLAKRFVGKKIGLIPIFLPENLFAFFPSPLTKVTLTFNCTPFWSLAFEDSLDLGALGSWRFSGSWILEGLELPD